MNRLLLLGILTLAACADPHQPLSADFGNAVNVNIGAQVINPNPLVTGAADTDGQRIGDAMNRYRTGKVTRLQPPLEAGRITSVPFVPEK